MDQYLMHITLRPNVKDCRGAALICNVFRSNKPLTKADGSVNYVANKVNQITQAIKLADWQRNAYTQRTKVPRLVKKWLLKLTLQ